MTVIHMLLSMLSTTYWTLVICNIRALMIGENGTTKSLEFLGDGKFSIIDFLEYMLQTAKFPLLSF